MYVYVYIKSVIAHFLNHNPLLTPCWYFQGSSACKAGVVAPVVSAGSFFPSFSLPVPWKQGNPWEYRFSG